jgi:flagellar motor protein MotB
MEKLMIQHATVGDEDLRELANHRAQTVRDALVTTGQVSADRLSVVTPKPLTSEEKASLKGKPNRVDFSLR